MQQTGPNEGVVGTGTGTALITIDGTASLFAVEMVEHALALKAGLIENTGPGDTPGHKTFRGEDAGGIWSGTGRARGDKRPMPLYLASARGNVRLVRREATGPDGAAAQVNYVSFAAVFSDLTFSHAPSDEGGDDVWDVKFTCVKSGVIGQAWDGLDGTAEAALQQLPASSWKEIWMGRSKSVDPVAIATSAQSAYDFVSVGGTNTDETNMLVTITAGAVSPVTGLKLRNKTITRTGSMGGRVLFDWGIDDNADALVNGGRYSTRSAFEPFTRSQVVVLNTTSNPETVADVYWPTFQAEAFAYRLSVRKTNNQTAVIVFEYRNPGLGMVAEALGGLDLREARVDSGNVQVFVRQVLQQGGGGYKLRMGKSRRRRIVRHFTLSRLLTGTSAPDFQSHLLTTNNATFFGLPAGSVLYGSCGLRTNLWLSGTYGFTMDYHYAWDPEGHFILDGWDWELFASVDPGSGWVNVAAVTDGGLEASLPAQSDFSGFLA